MNKNSNNDGNKRNNMTENIKIEWNNLIKKIIVC